MDVNRKELSTIKEVLKNSPRGMTVTEISKSVKMNRHSVAKYLEVLVAAGHVDMKNFGPSKVYFLSQRIPVSAMLSFSSDLILILDKDLRVRNLNDKFLEYMRLKREDMLNKNIENFAFTRLTEPPLLPGIKDALNGTERTVDTYYHSGERDYYLIIKFLPTVFEDGENGVTIIASDYTEHKRIEETVRESEHKFRDMLEQSTDGIVLIDERGTVIEFNASLESLTGYRKDVMVGKPLWKSSQFMSVYNRIVKGSPLKLISQVRTFIETGKTPAIDMFKEFNITRPDGKERTIHANVFPIKTDKGHMMCAILRDVTDMKNAEIAIKESEEKFRNLAETTTSGILIVQDDHIIYANRGIEAITGYSPEELSKVKMGFFVHPDYIEFIETSKGHMKKLSGEPKKPWEIKIITKDGRTRWINITVGVMKLNGRPAILKTFVDITERKEAEEALIKERADLGRRIKERTAELEQVNEALNIEVDQRRRSESALRESEERYRLLVEDLNDIIWEKDTAGRYTYLSPRMQDVLGYAPNEQLGRVLMEFMPVSEAEKIFDGYWGLFTKPATYDFPELRLRNKSGEEVILESRGSPHFDRDGIFRGYRGVARDITQRKRTEDALLKSEEKYRKLTENINDVLWEKDTGGKFTYMSPKIKDVIGFDHGEFIGRTILDFMPPAYVDSIREAFWQMFREPAPYSLREMAVLHKDGHEVFVEANGIPVYDERGSFQGYRGVTRDITRRKRMEEMLELMKYSIDHSEDAAFWVNRDAGFYYVNEAACRMLGYSREELLTMSVGDIDTNFTPEDWREHWEMIKLQKYHKKESLHRTKEGDAFLVEITDNYLEFNGKEYDFAFVRPISPPRHRPARPFIEEAQKTKE